MLEQFKVCYHGTVKKSADFIESKGINLNKSVKGTDFGQGFYVTSNFKQAEEWAKRYARTIERRTKVSAQPVVMVFNLDVCCLKRLKGKEYDQVNRAWGDFILQNRLKYQSYFLLTYDYAAGPLADGPMYTMLGELREGLITEKEFILKAYPKGKMKQYNQLSFHSKKAIECLTFKGVETVDEL